MYLFLHNANKVKPKGHGITSQGQEPSLIGFRCIGGKVQTSDRVYIVLDNLRVGGVQRLALDESYALSRQGKEVSVIILEEQVSIDDMREIDGAFFRRHSLKLCFLPQGRGKQILWFIKFIRGENPNIILCHSARSIGLIRLASLFCWRQIVIVAFLHQLASLSSRLQKFKRFILFSMANQVRASSKQFILEFEATYKRCKFLTKPVLKKMQFDRMGLDLSRIDWAQSNENLIKITDRPALIFNSRVTEWKGFKTFLELAIELGSEFQYILITSRMAHQADLIAQFDGLPTAKTFYGKNVSHFAWEVPCIHVYPTDYGKGVKYRQNIGLNVLECLSLGIPSIISHEGFESWPEFQSINSVMTTGWNINETCEIVRKVLSSQNCQSKILDDYLREVIGIQQHLTRLQKLFD